ncbi:HNH endonuclease signature motif containing protein [Spirillospora sp. NBC_01491]|uniref:HNH endonuclease signature motif containing protein n=1 Tax=Spirillospora sp. NBC_01491 TaxID=2976007 RepID=UPI002E347B50|nr:HNH endonuclease signature motif containing protein [Spirillospora sp. NBC_01491]
MKRGGRLERRTPLTTKTGLPRTGGLARRTPLRAVSSQRAAENRERRKVVHAVFGDAPRCVAPGCGRLADDTHEPLTRARGGSITNPSNMAPLCRGCHTEITDTQPDWAYAAGLLIHSWNGGDAA